MTQNNILKKEKRDKKETLQQIAKMKRGIKSNQFKRKMTNTVKKIFNDSVKQTTIPKIQRNKMLLEFSEKYPGLVNTGDYKNLKIIPNKQKRIKTKNRVINITSKDVDNAIKYLAALHLKKKGIPVTQTLLNTIISIKKPKRFSLKKTKKVSIEKTKKNELLEKLL